MSDGIQLEVIVAELQKTEAGRTQLELASLRAMVKHQSEQNMELTQQIEAFLQEDKAERRNKDDK